MLTNKYLKCNIINIFKRDVLSNYELEELADRLNLNILVAMKDELTNEALRKYNYFVINYQDHNQGGSHWVSFVKNKKIIYWFDSFGMVPLQNEINLFLKNHDKIFYNKIDIQSMESKCCGWFALSFLLYMKKNKNTLKAFKKFPLEFYRNKNTLKANDELLKEFLKNNINAY